jgi:hypothetical protein
MLEHALVVRRVRRKRRCFRTRFRESHIGAFQRQKNGGGCVTGCGACKSYTSATAFKLKKENLTWKRELKIRIRAENFLFSTHVKRRAVITGHNRAQQQKCVEVITRFS